jgi:cell fate regulator YaaT (PSP1 superfamily)
VVPDDDGPAPPITLGPDLPLDPGDDDPDPASAGMDDVPVAALARTVATVAGVRMVPTGKIYWCDACGGDYRVGDVVIVDGERSTRMATVAVAPARRAVPERPGRTIVRRAGDADLATQAREQGHAAEALRRARDKARELRLPAKVFRVEYTQPPSPGGRGGKINLYYTSEERVEMRELLRDLGTATGARVELRQVGVRDEAKHVGGIGSCGLELCCSTWLPDFVPVSIKMAKDQGLVLNPTKVSGQCGRLKCCLVYEQATYAEMRKGLPKLGKRVITATGEGRVVEVDVLRQRIRVAYGPGESQVLPAAEVKPMFPAQQPGGRMRGRDDEDEAEAEDDEADAELVADPARASSPPPVAEPEPDPDPDRETDPETP